MHMKRVAVSCFLILLGILGTAQAQNNSTSSYYEIKNVIFWSKNEPIYPQWAGYVSVEFTQAIVWETPGVCNSVSVAVRPEDNHIISAIQTALASGRSVRLYVDDAQRISGNYCILRVLQY
jgi:hypothetical protein